MKAVILTGIEQLELREIGEPEIQGGQDVLVKVARVGVCGSDVHYYKTGRIGSQVVHFPFRLGHECSGTVVEVGRDVKQLKPGEQVAVDPAMVCHDCEQCRMGRENTCRNLRFLGTPGQAEGCLCEYIVMPADSLYPTGGEIDLAQAVLCEPLSIAVYAVRQAQMEDNARIAVLGSGPIGLSVLVAARASGVDAVYTTDRITERVSAARQAGAEWAGRVDEQDVVREIKELCPGGVDVVFECAGEQDTLDQAVRLLRPGGRLMLIGIPRTERVSFVIDEMRRKEITLVNVRRQNRCVQPAIDLIASGKVDVDFMITHHRGPEQASEAFDMVAGYRDGVIKALIEFQ